MLHRHMVSMYDYNSFLGSTSRWTQMQLARLDACRVNVTHCKNFSASGREAEHGGRPQNTSPVTSVEL